MFNRILVPLDGSPLAERVLPHALEFARIFSSTIVLLQVLDPTSFHENPNPVDPISWQIRKAEADMYLQRIAARLQADLEESELEEKSEIKKGNVEKPARVEYSIQEGKTAENIVNFAHTENIDLLIISSHGSGGLSRWNISSVTQKVINQIFLPVLIVRAYIQPETEDTRIHYHGILLPVDTSRRAECSLSAGIALARGGRSSLLELEKTNQASQEAGSSTQTKLYLASVIKPPEFPTPEPYPIEIAQLNEQVMDICRQAVGHYLNEIKMRLSVDYETYILENNSVSSAIQTFANQDEDIDLVVLCAHGYTGEITLPYGSVARNYIEHGTKPVLIIQDVARSHVQPTAAEIAAEKSGGR
jgi:nucleotide-binding universal stress UspA family protein